MGQKKAAFTRAKNEEGTRKKNAERQAIKQAVDATTGMDAGRLKLVLLANVQGSHVGNHYGCGESMTQWLFGKLGIAEKANNYGSNDSKLLLPALEKLNVVELGKLLVEFSLKSLAYVGDIHSYKIETTEALNLLGIGINLEKGKDNESTGAESIATEVKQKA